MDMWLNDRGLAYHGPGPSLQCHKIIIIIIIIIPRNLSLYSQNTELECFRQPWDFMV